MRADIKKRGVQDHSRINIEDPLELRYWADRFETIPEIIQDATLYVGRQIKDIREWLHERGHILAID